MSWDEAKAARLAPTASPHQAAQLRIKRVMDLVGAIAALIALGPLLIIVAAVLRFDGPVFSRQLRLGRGGKPFALMTFRTMRSGGPTPIDGFLRETGIAELPQLFNVLKGEMSLVGPCPHAPDAAVEDRPLHTLAPNYEARLRMAPGMTGWAQVNPSKQAENAALDACAGIDRDIDYIKNFSIALDLRILWMTFRREFVVGTGKR